MWHWSRRPYIVMRYFPTSLLKVQKDAFSPGKVGSNRRFPIREILGKMTLIRSFSRRRFLAGASLVTAGTSVNLLPRAFGLSQLPLQEFGYGDVELSDGLPERQRVQTIAVLMNLSEDSLLKPFRQMAGQPAPGEDLGGWYHYNPGYDYHHDDAGLAPSAAFGQWVSALARDFAITQSSATRDKVLRLNQLYAKTISADFYEKNRFPAYCYDKLVCGLIDAHQFAADPDAMAILHRTTHTAVPHLPRKAIDREQNWRPGKDQSYSWDESYTMPENLFLAYQRGAGQRYRQLAMQYLDDRTYFDPLARGENVLGGKHAYSYVNALSSAMQAYLVAGSDKHLQAAKNAFDMLTAQSFATGGWGPDEQLRSPLSGDVAASLTKSHNSFETPCGSYAHIKLTRYLLRVTHESRYGDSMERVLYNAVLGAKPLQADGSAFYYSDYNFNARKVYSNHRWPCCSGTLPQVATDYRINSYFRDANGVYVNLYLPSTLRFTHRDTQVSLQQTGDYPYSESVQFDIATSRPAEFALRLRIPQWAQGSSIALNGKQIPDATIPGSFAELHRTWKSGDRVELELPLKLRLEAVDPQHPETVALLRGPLVLFPTGNNLPQVTSRQLLAAQQSESRRWQVETQTGALVLLPFVAIEDEPYSTYFQVSA
jgi:uncharacterized protein